MSCYHPIKVKYRWDGFKKDILWPGSEDVTKPGHNKFTGDFYPYDIKLPCGNCIGCRLDYSRQWALRCMLEYSLYEPGECWFLTLTYDDEHLPKNSIPLKDDETGEYLGETFIPTLCFEHLQKFFKDLRRHMEYHFNYHGIRYYACGEYGSQTERPHYHAILFGCPLPDVVPFKKSHSGLPLFHSEIISSKWDKGFAVLGKVTYQSCAYTARYMLKKHKGKEGKEYYFSKGQDCEFSTVSRRPGLAKGYYDLNKNHIYDLDSLVICDSHGKPMSVKPPAYFDRLFDVEGDIESFMLYRNKLKRAEVAENAFRNELANTSLDEQAYLGVKEYNKQSQIKLLTRLI